VSSVQPPQADASLGELFSDLTTDMSALMRDELSLAKVELKEEIAKAGRAGGMFGAAALAGYMTIVLLSFAAAWGLAELMAVGWAFLIVAVLWGVAGAFLYLRGREQFQKVHPKPEQTIDTLKEDLRWVKKQKP
jgi:uncharacterized membrane protein YqjE